MGPVDASLADIRQPGRSRILFGSCYSSTGPMAPSPDSAREPECPVQIQISLLLDRARPETLTAQLVGQVRDAIRVGRITPGARLPSSRRLSEQLGIGRNTVVRAYETLLMECYVESRPASGIFATLPPLDLRPAHVPDPAGRMRRGVARPACRGRVRLRDAGRVGRRPRSVGAGTESVSAGPEPQPPVVRFRARPSGHGAVPAEGVAPAAADLPVAKRRRGFGAAGRPFRPGRRYGRRSPTTSPRRVASSPSPDRSSSPAAPARASPWRHATAPDAGLARRDRGSRLPRRRRGVRGRRCRTGRRARWMTRAWWRPTCRRARPRCCI